MQVSTIQQIINHFIVAFRQLERQVALHEIEALATMIHRTMTSPTRSYHTSEHILHLADCAAPLQSLAALFHDIVYYQVDRGFPRNIAEELDPYITEDNSEIRIRDDIDRRDLPAMLTLGVFGMSPGQALPAFAGQNEFLSALYMNRKLAPLLPLKLLAKTSAYIEATIPFRSDSETDRGVPWTIALRGRLDTLPEQLQLSFSPEELDDIICSAVQFANRDVDGFSERDSGTFLSGTWNLIPENNSSLRAPRVYSIRDYRQALQKMAHFFMLLPHDNIFHRYQNTPPLEEYREIREIARRNVSIAREYLGIKLLAIAIIEALAELTGGDAPLLLFMGDLKQKGQFPVKRFEHFHPSQQDNSAAALNPLVSNLLEDGRSSDSSFDIKNSPISFFLYQLLEPEKIRQSLDAAQDMFHGKCSPKEFLATVEQAAVSHIASACAEMVVTRRDELLRYATQRKAGH